MFLWVHVTHKKMFFRVMTVIKLFDKIKKI